MVFHWSFNVSKSPQVSRTLLNILDDLNNAVVCMVSTCPFISKSPNSFTNTLVIVPTAHIINGITVTFIFQSFFFLVLWPGQDTYLFFCLLSILFCGLLGRPSPLFGRVSLFLFFVFFTITGSGRD